MDLARACGIVIPTIQLETIGGKDVLLLERFDRRKTKTGYARLGFISALSLMDWDDRERPLWSYISLADTMRATILAQPAQLSDLFRRVVFNILCRNTDDHPRNHGFLWGARGLELSPAYDLVPAPARLGVNTEFDLSMSLGERGREASLENALTMTSRFGLTRDQAEKIIGDMVEGTRRWEDHYHAHGVIPDDVDAIRACFQRAG
jgi:serine/threonine-protein kinase HipA